jgi:hypothetical protein
MRWNGALLVQRCFFRNTLLRGDFLYCVKLLERSLLYLTLLATFLSLSCVFLLGVIGLLGNRNATQAAYICLSFVPWYQLNASSDQLCQRIYMAIRDG